MESADLRYYKGYFIPFYQIIASEFDNFSVEQITSRAPQFKSLIKASFVKCFEFNHFLSSSKEIKYPFFLLGTLRSMCEDLIALSYLKSLKAKDREELIVFNLDFDIIKNLIVQQSFFNKYNSGQIVARPEQFADEEYYQFVKNHLDSRTLKGEGHKLYPSVYKMAKDGKYLDLYNYLYHATSSLVHFKADTLLKLGWNRNAEEKRKGIFHYSVHNYSEYYSKFNLAYGSLLFCEFVFNFSKQLNLPKSIISETKYFRSSFDLFEWPEIMTFDHMNVQHPHELAKRFQRSHFVVKNLSAKKKSKTNQTLKN